MQVQSQLVKLESLRVGIGLSITLNSLNNCVKRLSYFPCFIFLKTSHMKSKTADENRVEDSIPFWHSLLFHVVQLLASSCPPSFSFNSVSGN